MDAERRKTLEATTRWDPGAVEERVFERWMEGGWFHPPATGSPEENFSIAIPPPNVTGALHMGHALNGTIQDALIRLSRMRGRNTMWILGTDHAGIATQSVVEKELAKEGTSRTELGREQFIERIWEWRYRYGNTIIEQYKRLGASCDYERERFTLDEGYVKAVYRVFAELYDKGWIYRDNYMVNWDPGLGSAISDLEIENREVTDTLYEIAYPLEDGGELIVATVRPETMLADTAVAVNPDDDRYRDVVGKHAILPLVERRLPVIADEHVDPEFGTGALKITPGHDPNDFEIGRKHDLQEISVIGEDGLITDEAPERFRGMTAAEAQEAVVAELRDRGLIRGEEPYTHTVPFSHRSGERIEPLISLQWFCRMDEMARRAVDVVTEGKVRIIPDGARRQYLDSMEKIPPWCISRQLWWGHRLPVWYRGDETHVGRGAAGGRGLGAGGGRARHLVQLGALAVRDARLAGHRRPRVQGLLPDRRAGHGAGHHLPLGRADDHDLARVHRRGAVHRRLRPLGHPGARRAADVEEPRHRHRSRSTRSTEHGADALRFGLLAMSSTQDVRFSEARVQQGRDLANKMWNASRLILMDAVATPSSRGRDRIGSRTAGSPRGCSARSAR